MSGQRAPRPSGARSVGCHPGVVTAMGVRVGSQAVNRCSEGVRRCPRLVVQIGSPRRVCSRVTVSATGSPPRVGRAPEVAAAFTSSTRASARRAPAGTWSAVLRSRSARASIAAITASPSSRGRVPDRMTVSPSRAKDRSRVAWASASSPVGRSSAGGCSRRMALSTSRVIIGGDHCPHLVPNSAITAASCSSVSGPTLRATASTWSEVMIPAAHAAATDGCAAASAPVRASRRAWGEAHPRAASTAPGPTRGRLPAVVAACMRRANSYSTAANAPASTSTSAVGRSPASRPIAGRAAAAQDVARSQTATTSADAWGSAPTARGSTSACWS